MSKKHNKIIPNRRKRKPRGILWERAQYTFSVLYLSDNSFYDKGYIISASKNHFTAKIHMKYADRWNIIRCGYFGDISRIKSAEEYLRDILQTVKLLFEPPSLMIDNRKISYYSPYYIINRLPDLFDIAYNNFEEARRKYKDELLQKNI